MQIRISLKFSDGDFHQGFGLQKKLVLVVSNEDKSTEIEIKLPPAPEIPVLYQKWKDSYIKLANPQLARIKVKQVTRFSYPERHQECEKIAQELRNKLNQWLSNIKPELEAVIKLYAGYKMPIYKRYIVSTSLARMGLFFSSLLFRSCLMFQ